jgi:hypothetical protein
VNYVWTGECIFIVVMDVSWDITRIKEELNTEMTTEEVFISTVFLVFVFLCFTLCFLYLK